VVINTERFRITGILHPEDHRYFLRQGGEQLRIRGGKIHYPAATAAYQMGVGAYIAVKTFFPVYHPQGYHGTFFPEKIDVPVYRTQGKIGNPQLKLIVYPLRPGMGFGGLDDP
jgi:hypothetical protein